MIEKGRFIYLAWYDIFGIKNKEGRTLTGQEILIL